MVLETLAQTGANPRVFFGVIRHRLPVGEVELGVGEILGHGSSPCSDKANRRRLLLDVKNLAPASSSGLTYRSCQQFVGNRYAAFSQADAGSGIFQVRSGVAGLPDDAQITLTQAFAGPSQGCIGLVVDILADCLWIERQRFYVATGPDREAIQVP